MSKSNVNGWETAIADAERMIKESKGRIADLRRSIKVFRNLRDSGAPFPGEDAKQTEAQP